MTASAHRFEKLTLACFVGVLFVLPHAVRIWRLQSFRDYSPFSARTASMTVWDETFMYAAQVNYSYRHHRLAYDTDSYEHRDEPVPYSVLPVEVEVLFAEIFQSVGAAQIFCHFLFPAITAGLLMSLFMRLQASPWLAGFLALLVLIVGFSLLTFYQGEATLLRFGFHSEFVDTLQASRNPHPNMSFPLFLAALMVLCAALRLRSTRYALAAGVLGGLLFYTYIYYAIAWGAGIGLLTLLCLFFQPGLRKTAAIALAVTLGFSFPFLLWTRSAKQAGGYAYRSARLGMIYSRIPPRLDIEFSIFFFVAIVLVMLLWTACRAKLTGIDREVRQFTDLIVAVFGCAALGGIAGLNLQLVTGFNVQANKHYTHMVIQPALIIMGMAVLLALTARFRKHWPAAWGAALFIALFSLSAAVQVTAALNSADAHRVFPADARLFAWLERDTAPDDVVATTDLALATELPVFTHNYTLLANGTRSSGSDDEILDRFLLADALVSSPPAVVEQQLRPIEKDEVYHAGDPVGASYYVPFLFEHSPKRVPNLLQPMLTHEAAADALAKYRDLDLNRELHRFRVNYVYVMNGQAPATIAGWRMQMVLKTERGSLWKLTQAP